MHFGKLVGGTPRHHVASTMQYVEELLPDWGNIVFADNFKTTVQEVHYPGNICS